MADAPATPSWLLPAHNIAQQPFLQSWNGQAPPYANTMDQIQQSQAISGVFPGQMPDNTFLGNTAARYAFGRTLPGSSPYQGALTSYMQGKGMPTGVPLGILGLQNGIGIWDPPSGGPPFPGGSSPGNYPPPGGSGPPNLPGAGNPAPPPFPGGAGYAGGQGAGGSSPGGGLGGGLLGGNRGAWTANHQNAPVASGQHQAALQTQGMQALQNVTDPATRYMMAMAYRISPASIGLTNEQINQLEQSTMGSTFNKQTGQVQRNY